MAGLCHGAKLLVVMFFRAPLYRGTIVYWDDLQVCCILSKWGAETSSA
jgi:hypothetical protein